MNGVAKVLVGITVVGTGAVLVAAFWPDKRRTAMAGMGQIELVQSAERPQPISTAKAKNATVKVYRSGKLPIRQRLAIMQGHIAKGVSGADLPVMRKLALEITSHCPARDDRCEAKAIYDWVRENIRYTGDIAQHKLADGAVESVDLFQTARQTVEFRGGDCDDHNILVSTLAILNGIPARLRVTSPFRGGEDNYTHTYPALGLPKNDPKKWVAADTTLPGERFGVEAPYVKGLDVIA